MSRLLQVMAVALDAELLDFQSSQQFINRWLRQQEPIDPALLEASFASTQTALLQVLGTVTYDGFGRRYLDELYIGFVTLAFMEKRIDARSYELQLADYLDACGGVRGFSIEDVYEATRTPHWWDDQESELVRMVDQLAEDARGVYAELLAAEQVQD